MKYLYIKIYIVLFFISTLFCHANYGQIDSCFFENENWVNKIRLGHPRMFLNEDMLPSLKIRIENENELNEIYTSLVKEVDELPMDAPVILKKELFTELSTGEIKLYKNSEQGKDLFQYNGGEQAVKSAFIFFITKNPRYLNKAKSYLKLANHVFEWTAEKGIWVDIDGRTRIQALTAYDWIYNELNESERRELLQPILNYIKESQPQGKFKFRRTFGNETDGNYGERALQWFAGLTAYKTGVSDSIAENMLRSGAKLFSDMMNHRERVSAGSGLLSSATVSYSFGLYPFTTFNFLHTTKSALDLDFTFVWKQMLDYPKWFDFSAIKMLPTGQMLHHGIGDVEHIDNLMYVNIMYTHLAQTIHFYSRKYPGKMNLAYKLLNGTPQRHRNINKDILPFLPFLLYDFNVEKIKKPDKVKDLPSKYFYNKSFGLLLMRSGTEEDDTYASFRFGASETNHQHYDELSFVIYKKGFLALDAGSRTEADHHHNFAAQTVAHNTILIHQPLETMPDFWKAWSYVPDNKIYYNHGGQYVKNKAIPIALHSGEHFIYAAGDATKSYSEIKSEEVIRQFVYIKPNIFVVYDRVVSKEKVQKKEFLLHFQNEPEKTGLNTWHTEHGGSLFVTTLLPESPHFELVGGKGREFEASGKNWELPRNGGKNWDATYQLTGKWRLEISDKKKSKKTTFLHVLQAADDKDRQQVKTSLQRTEKLDIVLLKDDHGTQWELSFNRSGEVGLKLKQVSLDENVLYESELSNTIEIR